MAFFKSKGVGIAGIACAVPQNRVTVDSFIPVFGAEVTQKFTKGTGIAAMYKALPEQTAGDLAFSAAENLFSRMQVDRSEIGALIFVTQSPDYRRPSTACVLQKRLGLSMECATLEVALGCSGFIYGMQTAMSMMQCADYRYTLLLLGETASKLVDPHDQSIVMMYGDAGAAILLERQEDAQTQTLLRSDGDRFKAIVLPAGGFRDMYPSRERFVCSDGIERSLYDIFMDGTSVFSFSMTDVPKAIQDYLEHTQTKSEDYDLCILHQANLFMLKQIMRKLKLPKEKVPISLDRYGNTGGVSIPLTICDAYGGKGGETLNALLCGFGIGLSWGVMNASINTDNVFPIDQTADFYAEGKLQPGRY